MSEWLSWSYNYISSIPITSMTVPFMSQKSTAPSSIDNSIEGGTLENSQQRNPSQTIILQVHDPDSGAPVLYDFEKYTFSQALRDHARDHPNIPFKIDSPSALPSVLKLIQEYLLFHDDLFQIGQDWQAVPVDVHGAISFQSQPSSQQHLTDIPHNSNTVINTHINTHINTDINTHINTDIDANIDTNISSVT